jgi:inosose dehydratase
MVENMLDPKKVKLGIAPIGWTNDDMPDLGKESTFEQTISEMALAGFKGCEIGSKYPQDKVVLKHHLDLRGLTICNAWFSSLLTSRPYEETMTAFREHAEKLYYLGARVIGVSEQGNSIQGRLDLPILKNKPVFTAEQWKTIIKGFNEMGQIAKDMGMSFTYHHHMGTGIQTVEEIDYMMENTDPNLVFLLFDTGHLTFAGIEYLPVLKKHINRIKHVHLKDMRSNIYKIVKETDMSFLDAVRAGVFTVPGDGDVDFKPLVKVLEESGYEGWVVVEAEQDPAKANPFEYALKARKYIAEVTGL